MTTTTNEQYRAGFEAAARRITHVKDFLRASDGDGYRDYVLETYWQFWTASKREASTEPSAKPVAYAVTAARGGIHKLSITKESAERKAAVWREEWPNNGCRVRPLVFADELAAGALTDDAKDAARYRWLMSQLAGSIALDLDCSKNDVGEEIDAAIKAHAKAGSEKGEG